jgi:hypothetical protein
MCPPLAGSDYYEASAPPDGPRSATDLPTTGPDARREGDRGWFPRSPQNRSTREAPTLTPTASPRLRRGPSPWPPHQTTWPASESAWTTFSGPDRALHIGPYPSGSSRHWTYGASNSGSSRTPSRHCLPDPGRLTVPTRPVRCRGCSHPHARSHAQAAPSFTGQPRQASGGVISPPLDSQRLVAHRRLPIRRRGLHRRDAHPGLDQPIPHHPQRPSCRLERARLAAPATARAGRADADRQRLLADIQTGDGRT